jgi:hypothetical protein
VREVGSAGGSYHGKRYTHYNHNFDHATSPYGSEENQQLAEHPLRHGVSINLGIRPECGRYRIWGKCVLPAADMTHLGRLQPCWPVRRLWAGSGECRRLGRVSGKSRRRARWPDWRAYVRNWSRRCF